MRLSRRKQEVDIKSHRCPWFTTALPCTALPLLIRASRLPLSIPTAEILTFSITLQDNPTRRFVSFKKKRV